LNCIFDCEYCYLKGNFKTKYPVIFVNYEDIKNEITNKINEIRKEGYQNQITLYASNYSDIQ
jgi:spore photoproduct lyase